MKLVVDTVLFFARSGNGAVNADAAVGMLEQIAHSLEMLGPVERVRFLGYVNNLVASTNPGEKRQALESLAEILR